MKFQNGFKTWFLRFRFLKKQYTAWKKEKSHNILIFFGIKGKFSNSDNNEDVPYYPFKLYILSAIQKKQNRGKRHESYVRKKFTT